MNKWRDKAACKGMEASVFMPDHSGKGLEARAKDVCEGCPVKSDCLEHYMWVNDRVIAGGLTYRERQALKRLRVKAMV